MFSRYIHKINTFVFYRLTDFLSDAGERIAILRVVHRRVQNR